MEKQPSKVNDGHIDNHDDISTSKEIGLIKTRLLHIEEMIGPHTIERFEWKYLDNDVQKTYYQTVMFCIFASLGTVVFSVLSFTNQWGQLISGLGALGLVSIALFGSLRILLNRSEEIHTPHIHAKKDTSFWASLFARFRKDKGAK